MRIGIEIAFLENGNSSVVFTAFLLFSSVFFTDLYNMHGGLGFLV
ncbi:hypothetical protein DCCM_3752 [Desulfocucumis palustris]|uniref:Uncharacterized protein n=1 Tax=Desulfocucumis palustris TaxID=1898651 RepID=A0A2L2XER6_9FIRM|nr:hypothetical protein DCCM_3752 [Desulfocucumis palustris]